MEILNAELEKMVKEGKKETSMYESKTKELSQNNAALDKAKQQLASLYRQQKLSTMNLAELSRHIKVLNNELRHTDPGDKKWKKLTQELKATRERFQELSDKTKATGGVLQKISKISVGVIAAFTAIRSAIRGIANAVGTIADFEQSNANLSTILGKNVKEIKGLTDSARQLGATTEYTASQATQLQTELAKLGFKESDILNMQKPVLQFATAVGADLGEAASLAGATLRIFGLQSKDTEDTLGTLAVATNNSALNFSYLQTAMSIVGPVAKTAGFGLKDTTALLGTLANAGFDASSAATATRNIILNLANANGKLAQALGGSAKTFPELIDGLKSLSAKGVDLATTLELTDKRSVAAFNSFLQGADSALELRAALDEVDGELGRIAAERLNTVEGSIKLLKSAWEGLILSLSGSKGPIKWVIDRFTDLLTLAARLSRQFRIMELGNKINEDIQKAYKEGGSDAAASYIESQSASLRQQWENTHWWQGRKRTRIKGAQAALGQQSVNFQNQIIEGTFDENTDAPGSGSVNTNGGGGGGGGKSGKSWSLQEDEAYLIALADLKKRYNAGLIDSQEEYENELYKLEVSALTARLALNKEKGVERAKLEADLQDRIAKKKQKDDEAAKKLAKEGASVIAAAEEDKTSLALKNEEIRYKEELEKFKATKLAYQDKVKVIEAIEKKHQINLAKIKQEAFDRGTTLLETKYKKEKEQIRQDYTEKLAEKGGANWQNAAIKKAMAEEDVKTDLAYLKKLENRLRVLIGSKILSKEETEKYSLLLNETINKINELTAQNKANDAGLWGGTGGGSLFGVSEAQWGLFFYNLENSKMKAEDLVNLLGGLGNVANEGFQLATKAIANTNAKEQEAFRQYQKHQEEEKKALQTRLDSGLMSQAQYDAETQRMEAEAEAKQEAMKLKQAKREKSMNLIQAIINTALGVTKTLAQWGIPAGIAPAAIMSAMGAAQVALIASQPVTGAEEGGFVNTRREQDGKRFKARLSPDKRGFISSPTVLVGENGGEYVIPASGLDNPTLRPLLATIETARKAGRLKDLNFEAVYPVTSSFGRESGGYVRSDTGESKPNVVTVESSRDSRRLAEAIEQLNRRLAKPIKADVSMTGRNGIIEKTEEYNRAKNRGRYNG